MSIYWYKRWYWYEIEYGEYEYNLYYKRGGNFSATSGQHKQIYTQAHTE